MAKSQNREAWSLELKPVAPKRPAGTASRPDAAALANPAVLENVLQDLFDAVSGLQKSLDEISERLGSVEEKLTQIQVTPRAPARERTGRPIVSTEAISAAVSTPRPPRLRRSAAPPAE